MYLSFTVGAWAGSPWVSNSFSVNLMLPPAALASSMAICAPFRGLIPRLALGPVSGPAKASAYVAPPPPPPELVEVLFLLLLQAAMTIAATAMTATSVAARRRD